MELTVNDLESAMDMGMMDQKMMMPGMDMMMMQRLIDAASACEQACTMCAGSMGMDGMERCGAMCMTCADMSNTMMRMMLRPAGHHMESMMAMMQACMTMCMACAEECGQHTDMQACMMCAEACREMASACEAMMASMQSMSTATTQPAN